FEVALYCDMKYDRLRFFFLDVFCDAESIAFQFVLLSTRSIEHFGGRLSASSAPTFAAFPPFDEISAFRKRLPIVLVVIFSGNGNQFPLVTDFDLFEDVDASHVCLSG